MGRKKSTSRSNYPKQRSNQRNVRSNCVNCSKEVSASTYVALFKLPGGVTSVLEALEFVFGSARAIFSNVTPLKSLSTSYKFCHTCGEIFGQILKPLLKFFKLTSPSSIVSQVKNNAGDLKSKIPLVEDNGMQHPSPPMSPIENDNELNQLEADWDFTFDDENMDMKPMINDVRRSARILKKGLQQDTPVSEGFDFTSGSVFLQQIKQEKTENETIFHRLKEKYGQKMAAIRIKKRSNLIVEDKKVLKSKFKCKICSAEAASALALKMHLGTHAGTIHERPFICLTCNNNYRTKKGLIRHSRSSHPIEAEETCPRVRRHRRIRIFTKEEQDWLKIKEFKCAEYPCENISFRSYFEWLIHQRDHHQLNLFQSNGEPEKMKYYPLKDSRAVQPCPRCGKRLTGRQQILDHIRIIHLGEALYTCDLCGKTLSNKYSLEGHMEHSHSPKIHRKYLCAQCGIEFKSQGSLNSHEKVIHSNLLVRKFYECPTCKMKFTRRHRFNDHIAMMHSPADALPFCCEICGKGFKLKHQLKAHRLRHVKSASKDEICKVCGKAYSFKIPLREHLVSTHKLSREEARKSAGMKCASKPRIRILSTGEVLGPKPLKPNNSCVYCGRKYARRDLVFLHLMTTHGLNEETATSLTQLETKRKLVTGPGNVPVLLKLSQEL